MRGFCPRCWVIWGRWGFCAGFPAAGAWRTGNCSHGPAGTALLEPCHRLLAACVLPWERPKEPSCKQTGGRSFLAGGFWVESASWLTAGVSGCSSGTRAVAGPRCCGGGSSLCCLHPVTANASALLLSTYQHLSWQRPVQNNLVSALSHSLIPLFLLLLECEATCMFQEGW